MLFDRKAVPGPHGPGLAPQLCGFLQPLLALLASVSACAPPAVEPARQPLAEFCRFVRGPEANEALEASPDGVVTVEVALAQLTEGSPQEVGGAGFEATLRQWTLRVPAASDPLGTLPSPELAGLPRIHDANVQIEQPRGFFVDGSLLLVALPRGEELPETAALRYPVYVGSLDGRPFSARHFRGRHSADAIGIPPGATLEARLPQRAQARLSAVVVADAAAEADIAYRVALEGEERYAGSASRAPVNVAIELGRLRAGAVLSVRNESATSTLWLEDPALVRDRLPADPPNVVFVIVDTLRADRVGAQRGGEPLTPHFDRLRARSLAFDACWSTSSWTLPSVATLLTSNHGGQHGAWLNDRGLGTGLDTLAERFAAAGYATGAFTGGTFVSQAFGLDRGFAEFDSEAGGVEPVLARARAFLDRAGAGPWFLLLHTYEVHSPYEPPEAVQERVVERYLASHPEQPIEDPPEPNVFNARYGPNTPAAITELLAELYDEEVRYTDAQFGAFFDELDERGLFDASVVVLTSDHGEEFGEHGYLGHGDSLYAEQLHVPLLVHLPGGARAGEVDSRPVSHLDVAPTLLDAAGRWSSAGTFTGMSLLGEGRSPIYATRQSEQAGLLRSVREGEHHYLSGRYYWERATGAADELYSLDEDPGERENLAGKLPELGPRLRARLLGLSQVFDRARSGLGREVNHPSVSQDMRALGYTGPDEPGGGGSQDASESD